MKYISIISLELINNSLIKKYISYEIFSSILEVVYISFYRY